MFGIMSKRFYHTSKTYFSSGAISSLGKLRKTTGYTVSNCKKALEMFPGDVQKAEEWLHEEAKKLGWSKWNKIQSRTAVQGLVGVYAEKDLGIMVEVNCETDFVAKNHEFQKLVGNILLGCIENSQQSIKQNLGDFDKYFLSEAELMNLKCQSFNMQELLNAAVSKFNEKTVLKRAVILRTINEKFGISGLSHPAEKCPNLPEATMGKYGALVVYQQNEVPSEDLKTLGSNVCQHIIGMNPLSIGSEDFLSLYNSGKIKIGDTGSNELNVEKEILPQDVENEESAEAADMIKSNLKDSEETRLLFQSYILDPNLHVYDVTFKSAILDFERFECGGENKSDEKLQAVAV